MGSTLRCVWEIWTDVGGGHESRGGNEKYSMARGSPAGSPTCLRDIAKGCPAFCKTEMSHRTLGGEKPVYDYLSLVSCLNTKV